MKIPKGLMIMLMLILTAFGITACASGESGDAETTSATAAAYEQITAEQAKNLMDTETGYIILDARTEEEFAEGHIEGAILIPEYEIADRAEQELPDKDQLILVYCRSGRRSKVASQALADLGYTNVKEFGGIIDWQYGTVKYNSKYRQLG